MIRTALLVLTALVSICGRAGGEEVLRLATTTSTQNSGLLDHILPPFERRFGARVEVIAVGSGAALRLAERGDADLVLTHAPRLEEQFVSAGFGVNRRAVMYNDFVVVGPGEDPARVRSAEDAAQALDRIARAGAPFISRGDDSGTHQKERELWEAAGRVPSGPWYRPIGQGMGQALTMAHELRAYTLSDRGTFLAMRKGLDLEIVHEGDPRLRNPYAVIATNPARHPHVRYVLAMALIGWFTSPEGQRIIDSWRVDGQRLFVPLAVPPRAEDTPAHRAPLSGAGGRGTRER